MTILNGAAAPIRGGMLKGLLLFALGSLAACASFDGQQRAMLTPAAAAVPAHYLPSAALETYANQRTPEERAIYRNAVIGIYMISADADYREFTRMLSRESKGANFALGSGFTALTTAATVAAQRTANILSAFASGLNGIQGRLSSEVYFERTLPALLAGMEAQRTRIRTNIVARLGQKDEYSLTEAFLNLSSYAGAGSLDSAIETVTNQASQLRQREQARFENVRGLSGIASPTVQDWLTTFGPRIDALVTAPNGLASLTKISEQLGLSTSDDAETQATNINLALAAMDIAALNAFVAAMQAKGVDLSQ